MQTLKQTFKQVLNPSAWRQVVIVFLAGVVLLVSTACNSSSDAATSPRGANVKVDHSANSGTMYPHKDTERDTSAADAKADRLIRQAEQRLDKSTNPKELVDNVTPDKSLEQQASDVSQSARQAVKNIGKSTQRAAENAADAASRATNPS